MLSGNIFNPNFNHIIFLFREIQQKYIRIEQKLGVIFKKFANLKIENFENSLLIIDDPCEENYYDKKFIKFATAGRHKNINIIYLKHNHYQQSKWFRTKDLNTCHIIFKSARAIQQVEFLVK